MITEGRKIHDRITIEDMEISVEVPAGGTRSGTNSKGEKWTNKVASAYGYIKGTHSPDGEHLDVWIRKGATKSPKVYVVHQLTPDGSRFDEDKVMLGFSSEEAAIKAFKAECFKPAMFGGISEFGIEHFKVIAYSASTSKAMLATQKMFDKFQSKGLLPKGIKSPIQVSRIVKESNMALRISYQNQIIAETALELSYAANARALKSGLDLIFEDAQQLDKFIRYVDESQNPNVVLGNLHEMLPEDMETITESNLTDAIDDLKSELRVDDGDPMAVCDEIARDYGLDGNELQIAFERAVNMPIRSWAAHRDGIRRNQEDAKQAAEKKAADELAVKKEIRSAKAKAAAAERADSSPKVVGPKLATEVMDAIGDAFPDGDPYDVKDRVLRRNGLSWDRFNVKYERAYNEAWKRATGTNSEYEYLAQVYRDMAADNPEEYDPNNNPYESIEEANGYSGMDPYEYNARAVEEAVKELMQQFERNEEVPVVTAIEGLADDYNVHPDDIIDAFTQTFGVHPEEYIQRVGANESMDALLKLAGVKTVMESQDSRLLVQNTKRVVESLTEAHNTAIRKYMVRTAQKLQTALVESRGVADLDSTLRRFTNTLLANPQVPADKVMEKVAVALLAGDTRALREHLIATTGLLPEAYKNAISQRQWNENKISRQTFESLLESTDSIWGLDCPDRGTAFTLACK